MLEPISGYLTLASCLATDPALHGEAFNFGPISSQTYSVSTLLERLQNYWPGAKWKDTSDPNSVYEAGLLKLCCDKAFHQLNWEPILSFRENIEMTANWYRTYYEKSSNIWEFTKIQVNDYKRLGIQRGVVWG